MMQEEYQISGSGADDPQYMCLQCQTPLPLEPDLIRHVKMSIHGPITSWEVRRCPSCGISNVRNLNHDGEEGNA